jgi:hypothetical protein
MHPAEFNALGLTQVHAARLFGVGPRSVRRWQSGARRVPRGVDIVVSLLRAGVVTVDQIEKAIASVPARPNGDAGPKPVEPEPEQSAVTRAEVGAFDLSPAAAAVVTLGPNSCHWPIGDPRGNFCFCGASVVAGAYCERHRAEAYLPRGGGKIPPVERSANSMGQGDRNQKRRMFHGKLDGPEPVAVT